MKHTLGAKYYLRYVDDFVVLNNSQGQLTEYQAKIQYFLADKLKLQLHPDKSRIIPLSRGIEFLGLKLFPHHKVIKKKNIYKFERKLKALRLSYNAGKETYDPIYNFMEGWIAYVKRANTYKLRQKILSRVELQFQQEVSTKEYNLFLREQKHNSPK